MITIPKRVETPVITVGRVMAMSHISRWRGWTDRPFSILEHSMIGYEVATWFKWPEIECKKWLLHDVHETEIIGDVPTPDKKIYCNESYHAACGSFDATLSFEFDLPVTWMRSPYVKRMDRMMRDVEHDTIATIADPGTPVPNYRDGALKMIRDEIRSARFAGEKGVEPFLKALGVS